MFQMLLDDHGATDLSYILSGLLLRVTRKPQNHLESVNEPPLATGTSGDEADHWAGHRVKGPGSPVCLILLRIISAGLVVRDRAFYR